MPRIVQPFLIGPVGMGRLSMMGRPTGGNYLAENVSHLASLGVTRVVSLLDPLEMRDLGLGTEAYLCGHYGVDYQSFPIRDRDVPWPVADFVELIDASYTCIDRGGHLLVHCWGGIGRSGLFAIALLIRAGLTSSAAIERVSRARGVNVPETRAQRDWLQDNHQILADGATGA